MIKSTIIPLIIFFLFTGCEKFLNVEPKTKVTGNLSIINEKSAEEATLGLYNALQAQGYFGILKVLLGELASDVCSSYRPVYLFQEFDRNEILPTNSFLNQLWKDIYFTVLQANYVIEKIPTVANLPQTSSNRMIGEALFIRALAHYNLMTYFGPIPLARHSDLLEIQKLYRSDITSVYQFIIEDLTQAIELLPETYPAAGSYSQDMVSRARATKSAARSLLARVLISRGSVNDLDQIISLCSEVIANPAYQIIPDYSNVFKNFSKESIFEVFFDTDDRNSISYQTMPDGDIEYVASPKLVADLASDPMDTRVNVVAIPKNDYYYCKKFQSSSSNVVAIRLAEIYLIRAEAYALKGSAFIPNSLSDLNVIRTRAGVINATAASTVEVLEKIYHERYIELAFEGFRYFDLNRTGKANNVMGQVNPDTWQSTDVLFPLPIVEVELGLTQNDGY